MHLLKKPLAGPAGRSAVAQRGTVGLINNARIVYGRPADRSAALRPFKGPLRSRSPKVVTQAFTGAEAAGIALFFAPGLAALAYAYIKGKGNLTDGLSRLLTDISQGYFQVSSLSSASSKADTWLSNKVLT